jgi:hypothetical protein
MAEIVIERHGRPAVTHPEALAAVQTLVDHLEAPHLGPTVKDPEWFGWIALRLELFFDGLLLAREVIARERPYERPSFLDVGSGIGSKAALAHEMGFAAHGIERHEHYLNASRRLFPHVKAVFASAETYDGYGEFDLIYCYGCAASREHQAHINRLIAEQMAPGAMFFAPRTLDSDTGLEPIGHCVWRKQ